MITVSISPISHVTTRDMVELAFDLVHATPCVVTNTHYLVNGIIVYTMSINYEYRRTQKQQVCIVREKIA